MNTLPLAHEPQLDQHSGYFGIRTLIVDIGFFLKTLAFYRSVRIMRGSDSAPVAQLDRVSGYEPEGRAFESLRAHQASMKLGTSSEVPFFILAIAFASLALLPVWGSCSFGTDLWGGKIWAGVSGSQ